MVYNIPCLILQKISIDVNTYELKMNMTLKSQLTSKLQNLLCAFAFVVISFAACMGTALAATAPQLNDKKDSDAIQSFQPVGKEIAITFDDLPSRSAFDTDLKHPSQKLTERHNKILRVLKKHHVTTVGFVNEAGLYGDGPNSGIAKIGVNNDTASNRLNPARVAILQAWVDNGQELGNHTYQHLSLNATPLATYENDVLLGQQIFPSMMQHSPLPALRTPRYFRHPFLRIGRSLAIQTKFEKFLHQHGYTIAPVTVDTDDWMFEVAYIKIKQDGDKEKAAQLRRDYLQHTAKKFDFYEATTEQLFGRPIRHIWLLHARDINADCLDKLLQLAKQRGYKFITLEEALQDPVYKLRDKYTGPAGLAWLFHWDYSNKKIIDWKMEPNPPGYVEQAVQAEKH
jgi:peptidoglycan-N-acetylglucosamine deacetylase